MVQNFREPLYAYQVHQYCSQSLLFAKTTLSEQLSKKCGFKFINQVVFYLSVRLRFGDDYIKKGKFNGLQQT